MEPGEIRNIQDFFLEAMMFGWASESMKESIPQLPGVKAIPYRRDNLYLLDYYFSNRGSNLSYGTTTIWLAERIDQFRLSKKPVWVMHYGGWYDERAIPFLKRALMRNYREKIFTGGRGPERLEGEDHTLQYLNRVKNRSNFLSFEGTEQIITTSEQWGLPVGQKVGEHHYFGGIL